MTGGRAVVAATTWDYIDIIEKRHPGRAVFVTEPGERASAPTRALVPEQEVPADPTDLAGSAARLMDYLAENKIKPLGVACFDCGALNLAARLARLLGLPFASPEAVFLSRDKAACKRIWRGAGLRCPDSILARNAQQIRQFMRFNKGAAVIKPVFGTGGEGVFFCAHPSEATRGLRQAAAWNQDGETGAVVEKYLSGPEYSCDFIIDRGSVTILRLARKYKPSGMALGTVAGYLVTGPEHPGLDGDLLARELARACGCLGLDRSLGMADFIWLSGRPCFLEITPRPGGDCLPWTIEAASGLDMWALTLDFAAGLELRLPDSKDWQPMAGLRLIADRPGLITGLDITALAEDERVRCLQINRGPGHRVVLPPRDYDSRQLGHVIFQPRNPARFEQDCRELGALVKLEIRQDDPIPPPNEKGNRTDVHLT